MAASDFPSTLRDPKSVTPNQKAFINRQTSNAGYSVSRRMCTKVQKQWKVSWSDKNLLSSSERDLILSHHSTYAGSSFAWTDPDQGSVHTVTYITDELEFVPIQFKAGYYSLDLVFQEV